MKSHMESEGFSVTPKDPHYMLKLLELPGICRWGFVSGRFCLERIMEGLDKLAKGTNAKYGISEVRWECR